MDDKSYLAAYKDALLREAAIDAHVNHVLTGLILDAWNCYVASLTEREEQIELLTGKYKKQLLDGYLLQPNPSKEEE